MASSIKHIIPQILVFIVCILVYNHTLDHQNHKKPTDSGAAVTGIPTMATTTISDPVSGDVKEIYGVKIERNPPQSKLQHLGVSAWPKWGCGPSRFPWTFTAKETMYLLDGKVNVYCDGHDESFTIGAGDLVEFPKGMKITWDVIEAVNKHYNLDK